MSVVLMLDTNAVSALVKGQAEGLSQALTRRPFCMSVITGAELRYGLARRPVKADLRRIVESLLLATDIRPWNSACAERYGLLRAELESKGKSLAPMDLLIATHALAENCTLVSADAAFVHVPDLKHIDWTTVQTDSGII